MFVENAYYGKPFILITRGCVVIKVYGAASLF